ncbi:hypothetical protein B0O99DRAFT_594396 [Bisporella sp. PMI_857]|nr:hypothetical protein B0O99DRAFT_594396 [Bisporella sp. PMI_857]
MLIYGLPSSCFCFGAVVEASAALILRPDDFNTMYTRDKLQRRETQISDEIKAGSAGNDSCSIIASSMESSMASSMYSSMISATKSNFTLYTLDNPRRDKLDNQI